MGRVLWLAAAAGIVIGAYLAVLFVVQRAMLFPIPQRAPEPMRPDAELVRIPHEAGEAHAVFLAPPEASSRAPLLMFMHGNGELASDWAELFDEPLRWGAGVLLVEYPGYGGAPGSPSESSIRAAARSAYDWAAAHPRIDGSRIVAYGRSLGGGAAALLATERRVAALVLESAFTSVADFAAGFLAPSFLIRDPFDTRRALGGYRGPLLVIHGRHDTLVPIAHGRELAALVPGARMVELDCGHNDCSREWANIRAFLQMSGVLD